ncbi:NrfD/PsrC family molybdoenzyme membrane anchor subunit [Arabiibacter massiliensis]|uniref:NrfD/PsrC family molybdoenzyme membrane anchor subunit n=1 Tax=Arabiibacter massiliensis TaxID=1870985 RepID=UPI0009BBDDD8|nr:NrfD/PsrC family molybdoenzyme membrane anchor subunit [Arabiibacter massiliensis]
MVNSFIVWYLFLAGAGGGAFLVGAAVDLACRFRSDGWLARLEPLAEGGLVLGPVAVVLGAVFLLADLGSPERALRVFATASTSLLTLGSWSVGLFCACSIGALVAGNLADNAFTRASEAVLQVLATLSACFVVVYSGLYLSTFPTIPFLHSPLVPALFVASSLSAGVAIVLLFGFALQERDEIAAGVPALVKLDVALLVFECAVLTAFVAASVAQGGLASASTDALLLGDQAGLFWLGAVGVGLAAPLAAEAAHLLHPDSPSYAAGALCSLAGGLCLRYALLLATVRYSAIDLGGVTFWG